MHNFDIKLAEVLIPLLYEARRTLDYRPEFRAAIANAERELELFLASGGKNENPTE